MMKQAIASQIKEATNIFLDMQSNSELIVLIEKAAQACIECLKRGNKIMLVGNGGSAADAQHIAGEFVSRFAFDRPGLPAMALTTDSSILTSIANDYDYAYIFARQVQAHACKGDVLIAYSTSGSSANIIAALKEAEQREVITIGMTGNRCGPIHERCVICLSVPSSETPRIQEGHAVLGHIICGLVESAMFGDLR